jgi:predicted  nucleic acid-binding Zn-ribbon protein
MLEDTRDQIANLQVQTTQMSEQAKSSESELDREADSNRRTAMEAELKGFKQIIEPLKQRLEQLKERETRLNLELQTEQGKLNELEGRLEGLEREIESEIEKQREASGEKKGNNK